MVAFKVGSRKQDSCSNLQRTKEAASHPKILHCVYLHAQDSKSKDWAARNKTPTKEGIEIEKKQPVAPTIKIDPMDMKLNPVGKSVSHMCLLFAWISRLRDFSVATSQDSY